MKVYLRSVQEALLLTRQVFTNKDGSQGCLCLITSDTTLSYDQINHDNLSEKLEHGPYMVHRGVPQVAQTERFL